MITFNRPYATGREFDYIQEAIDNLHLSGNGPFDARCAAWLQERTGAEQAFMTGSCTSALEMSMLLAGIGPGDEVIVPSFTFVSTASAVAMRGGTPVFVDIRPDTLNVDEVAVAGAVTPRTKAIVAVHYAGVGAEMDALCEIARRGEALLIEDAAQGIMASYRGRPLGSFGSLACLSFHETKNVTCGEGGALLVNDAALLQRAEIVQEKGTDRRAFNRGEVDKYTWVDLGSSFLNSEVAAAFLWAQLEAADEITAARLAIWKSYHERFAPLEERGLLRRPVVPEHTEHNAHMYYLLLADRPTRDRVIADLAQADIQAVFHYVPLHSSPAGQRFGRTVGPLPVTDEMSGRLVRLPLWMGMGETEVDRVVTAVSASLRMSVPAP